MPRVNLCPLPALKNASTGWFGPTGAVRVTGVTGMLRTTGFRSATAGSYALPQGAVTAGLPCRFSAYVKGDGAASTGTCNINWYDGSGYLSSSPTQAWTVANGAVTRLDSLTQTAPAGAVGGLLTVDGTDGAVIITAALYEQATTLGTYFDGDEPGATWDGADGASTSTLADASTAARTRGFLVLL